MSGHGHLLVVGDERLAERLTDFSVTTADDAATAMTVLGSGDPPVEVVVTTHDLPATNGVSLLGDVRNEYPSLPVVLVADDGDEALASTAIAHGVSEYVPGSADDAVLVDAVERALAETPRERASDGITEGDALMDPVIKTRAMDEAPIGITISNPDLPDNPMVYINRAFADLTGYPIEDSLGRNCRFLQGPETTAEPVRKMCEAVEAAEPVSVELRNYRADGTEFWNRVDIAPLRDEDGEVTHFVGFQTDITERVEAERAAERRAEELAVERERMARLVARVEDLLESTMDALVRATSREDVATGVCDVVASVDPYVGAWLGSYEMGDETLSLAAAAGVDLDRETFPLDPEGRDASTRAVETGEVQVTETIVDEDVESWHAETVTAGASALVAVPLVVNDRCYGVLHCYVSDASVLDDHERTVFGALGRMTATALDAMAARRVLTADSIVEMRFTVRDDALFVAGCTAELDCHLEYAGSVHRSDGRLRTFFRVTGTTPAEVVAFAAGRRDVADVTIVSEDDDTALLGITFDERSLIDVLADRGGETRSIEASDGVANITVTAPQAANPRALADYLTETYDDVDLVGFRERERQPTTREDFVGEVRDRLTDRQSTALELAHLGGYFERPRPVSGDELAESMDVSRATFHQHLRAAEDKLVSAFFEE